jgi:anti-sigma regulatory factor (Ser/Thr protein kinase)
MPTMEATDASDRAAAAGRSAWALSSRATADAVPRIRRSLVELAKRAGADAAKRDEIAIAATEACTNVVLHAYVDRDDPGPIRVSAEIGDGNLRLTVRDSGRGMGPRPDSPGLGMGLQIMARLARRMQVSVPAGGRGTELQLWFALH